MDAKQLGAFITERRKALGFTQAVLAEKLHVTDKAVSRWERGVGLPDINSIEALAESLDVSILEIMQAKKNEEEQISKEEAEELLLDTIHLSKTANKMIQIIGGIILIFFLGVSVFLLAVCLDMKEIPLNVISFVFGLMAWGIPIGHIAFAKTKRTTIALIFSFSSVLLSLISQFYELERRVHFHDWSALLDTIGFVFVIVVFLSCITILLNVVMLIFTKYKK